MFGELSPVVHPPEGISWPAKNSSQDIQNSTCAIIYYFNCHILNITKNLIENPRETLNTKLKAFKRNFEAAARQTHFHNCTQHCRQREMPVSDDYAKKVLGLQILHFSRIWVEHFANDTCLT